ncbi:Lectin C-type domain containing protein [Aphelenchoides avenae]|nr:Lectin C-type domain containing protein [Aphelenchus avenae]
MRAVCFFLVACSAILLTKVVAEQDMTSAIECPDGWRYFPISDKCYKVLHERLTFDEAKAQCNEVGGHLASVSSREEFIFTGGITRNAWGKRSNVALELAKSASEPVLRLGYRFDWHAAQWKLLDGSDQFHIAKLGPRDGCFGIWINRKDQNKMKWVVLDCKSEHAALCQRKPSSTDGDADIKNKTLQEADQQIHSLKSQLNELRLTEESGRKQIQMLESQLMKLRNADGIEPNAFCALIALVAIAVVGNTLFRTADVDLQCDVCCKRGLFPVPLKDGADDSDDTLSEEPSFEELDNDGYNN